MSEGAQRAAVIAEAHSWLRTPWRHGGDVKGQAVDCAMLLIRVFHAAGVIAWRDPRPYPQSWFLHQDEERFLDIVRDLGGTEVEAPQPGDAVVYRFGRSFSHGAILVAPKLIIHAWATTRCVMLTETFDGKLANRPCRCFDPWAAKREKNA